MFDWDKDFEAVVTRTALLDQPAAAGRNRTRRPRILRWLVPIVVVVGAVFAVGSLAFNGPWVSANASVNPSFGDLRAAFLQPPESQMPDGLIIYDSAQYTNFMRGIIKFSDSDLLQFAATTSRHSGSVLDPMTPYLTDVLFLTNREISRRHLTPRHKAQ